MKASSRIAEARDNAKYIHFSLQKGHKFSKHSLRNKIQKKYSKKEKGRNLQDFPHILYTVTYQIEFNPVIAIFNYRPCKENENFFWGTNIDV